MRETPTESLAATRSRVSRAAIRCRESIRYACAPRDLPARRDERVDRQSQNQIALGGGPSGSSGWPSPPRATKSMR